MSINVTVHGNPISIKRGRMVSIDADKEFERRRKIRLQQVRQQSKEIAEEVRNKVRREKKKQLSTFEKHADKDLKRLQERKLLTLQKQYQETLQQFGDAYKSAENEPDPDEVIQKVSDISRNQAQIRGKYATEKQKEDKLNEEKLAKKHIINKKYARDIENVRAELVSSIQKGLNKENFKPKRKKKIANVTINGVSRELSDNSDNSDDSDDSYNSEYVNLSVFDDTSANSSPNKLDSQGNSFTSSKSSPKHISTKENDVDVVCANKKFGKHDECKFNCLSPEVLRRTKISFKNDKSKHFCASDEFKDENSYKSHTGKYKKKDNLKNIANPSTSHEQEANETTTSHPLERKRTFTSHRPELISKNYEKHKQTSSHTKQNDSNRDSHIETLRSISDRIKQRFKESDKENDLQYIYNNPHGSIVSDQGRDYEINDSINDDTIKKYRERLQSGTDSEVMNLYFNRTCDDFNCPVIRSAPVRPKPEIQSLRTVKSRNINPTGKSPFRKTIRSIKSPLLNDTVNESEVIVNVHDYGISEDGIKTLARKKSLSPKISSKKQKSTCGLFRRNTETCLPYVPTITLRPESSETVDSTIRFYDHFNRFAKDGQQTNVVQKISKDSIEVGPPSDEERQYRDIMIQRDEDAKQRGIKALEKNKIHRDYQQLLEELPILQRQERLASMTSHNPALHMSEERYKDLERKKQNRMENLYDNYEMKAKSFDIPVITLKSVRKSPPNNEIKQPFKALDVSNTPVLNVGHWEAASTTNTSSQGSPEATVSNDTIDKEQGLADLLRRVNKQREILLKEAANLPSLQSLKRVLNEEELMQLVCECSDLNKQKPPTILIEKGTSPLVIKESNKKIKKIKSPCSKTSSKRSAITSSSDTSVEVPRSNKKTKKSKSHKKFKILIREEGTQTTPTISKSATKLSKIKDDAMREEGTQTTCCPNIGTTLCLCSKNVCRDETDKIKTHPADNSTSTSDSVCDKMCDIIIKASNVSNGQVSQRSPSRTGKTSARSKISNASKKESSKNTSDFVKPKSHDKSEGVAKNIFEMSTSTSYMSPPADTSKKSDSGKPSISWKQLSKRSSNKELLQPQKQQTNIDNLVRIENGTKEVNPRLVKYITRLLNMSRQSIDELTISSVSDVSTPTESIMQSGNNVAMEKLQSVMNHFNLSVDDIKKYYLSTSTFSTDSSDMQKNTDSLRKDRTPLRSSPKQFISVSTSTDLEETIKNIPKSLSTSSSTVKDSKSPNLSPRLKETKKVVISSDGVEKSTESELENFIKCRSQPAKHSPKIEKGTYVREVQENIPKIFNSTSYTIDKGRFPQFYYPSCSEEPKQICTTIKSPVPSTAAKSKNVSSNQICSPPGSPSKCLNIAISSDAESFSNEDAVWRQPEKFLQFVRESLGMSMEEFSELGFQDMFSTHMELTEYCHDRIKSLMDLIERVRNDKRQIYSPSPIDQSMTLTSYLELPQSKHNTTDPKIQSPRHTNIKNVEKENSDGSGSSITQTRLDDYLLQVDRSESPVKKEKTKKQVSYEDQIDSTLIEGIQKFIDVQETFVPMLQGIPKYCEDDSTQQTSKNLMAQIFQHIKPKPPPSLLRSNMRGHTDLIPHELSTIAEAETIVSSRNTSLHPTDEKIRSREISPARHSLISGDNDLSSNITKSMEIKIISPVQSNKSSASSESEDYVTISPEKTVCSDKESRENIKIKTPTESNRKSAMSGVRPLSDSTTDSPDELESMLRKFKLEWAIALVRKTEQALALSSSSSSSDILLQKTRADRSDLNLREACQQMFQKLASSSGSDIERSQIFMDLSQHFREFHDMSDIPGLPDNKNKSQQRTSTPVQHSRSTDSKKSTSKDGLFKCDSDLSSVRNSSDENMFLSIPNITLNTTKCSLNKSKK